MPTALEQAAPLGFLGARAPRGGPAAREHPPVADVSSQVSLSWGCTGCGCLVTGVPSSVGLCDTAVTSLPGTPSLTHSWRKLQGRRSGLPTAPPSLQAMACAHSDTTTPLSTGPREGLCAPRAPAWTHTWVQTRISSLPRFDPREAVVPVGDGLHLARGTGIILAGASSRRPQATVASYL